MKSYRHHEWVRLPTEWIEQKRLQAYKLLIGEIADDPTEMTVEDFVDALLIASPERPIIDHLVNRTPTLLGFGIPDVGLGIQIEQQLPVGSQPDEVAKDRETSKTKIVDSMILSSNEFGYTFDQNGYGVGEFDKSPDTTVIVIPGGLPPLPSGGLPAAAAIVQLSVFHVVGTAVPWAQVR